MNEQHIQHLLDIIKASDLKYPTDFSFNAKDQLSSYNGIGPDWLNDKAREIITKDLAIYEPAAMIHDWMYGDPNKSKLGFDLANAYFYSNCIQLVKKSDHSFFSKFVMKKFDCLTLYTAVKEFGWNAYVEGKR